MTYEDKKDRMESIAIIGMAGRFPGAENVNELWENIKNGVDSRVRFSDEKLLESGVQQSLVDNPHYVKSRCVLEDAELFDASFFGFTPREAEYTDPQHRIFLECAWEALESAGYDPETYDGAIGVFAGCGMNQYLLQNIIANHRMAALLSERQLQVSSDKDFLATRVSYKLNLKGPSLDIQTGCSTSLVAVHIACQNLLDYQCDMALSGGAYLQLPRISGFVHSDGDMRSPDGCCRAFDADANGTVFGDGAGVIVLKRLQDAVEDRDTILAVIRSTAINNDGAHKVGFSAPSVEGQARVISMAHMMADVNPESISYIETHGTGTPLGDSIEIAALTKAFRSSTNKNGFCAIGSIKTNIGHLDAASGVTGLIKTVLSIYHKQIPQSLNYRKPKPELNIETSPFYVNTRLIEWNPVGYPRRAGVSSFGVGGTNAHAILEESPQPTTFDNQDAWQILTLSARSEAALDKATENLLRHFEQNLDTNLADAAYTLQVGRRHFDYRRTIICKSMDEAISALRERPANFVHAGKAVSRNSSTVFLFTGQGSQYVGMAQELYETEASFREVIDYCANTLLQEMNLDLRDLIFTYKKAHKGATAIINQTDIAQPALFMIEYALVKLWEQYGIVPEVMIGHSIGEYVAACISGVFNLEDALRLVASRGALMQRQPGGTMISVALSEDSVKPYLNEDIELSVINSPNASVLSGDTDKIQLLEQRLQANGIKSVRLHTSHAFHSKMMEPVLEKFKSVFDNVRLEQPKSPFLSNLTGDWITPDQATSPVYWTKHIRHTIRFSDGVCKLLSDPDRIFVEVGPGNTLSSIVRQVAAHTDSHQKDPAALNIFSSLRHPKQQFSDRAFFLQTMGKLWLMGEEINWNGLHENKIRYRLHLPTYPFEHKKYWIEPDKVFDKQEHSPNKTDLELKHIVNEAPLGSHYRIEDNKQTVHGEFYNKTAQVITDIWKDLLGIDNIDGESNFFDLGGDSVCASQVLLRISNQTGITLSLSDMFDNSTINSIVQVLESKSGNVEEVRDLPINRINREQKLPLSRGQQRLWFLSRLEPESPAFNLALGLKIEGDLDIDILREAINTVIERHEPLRTTFIEENGDAKAVINDHAGINLEFIDATKIEGGEEAAFRITKEASAIPFDLERGPLTRWYLLRLKRDLHILVYQVHHIIFDGWSLGVVLKEIGILYEAYDQNKEPLLPTLNVQYVDCAVWYEEWLINRKLSSQIDYWTKQLSGQLPILQLPRDRPRPKMPNYSGSFECFELPELLSNSIKALSKREGVTFFMLFMAAFKVLLFRYSGQEDIIIGTPVANRNHMEMEKLVGFFINMLALRSDLSGNPPFNELLARIRKTSLDAFAHQDLPFEQLVDILQPSRDMSLHPLYQVMFAFHNFPFPPVTLQHIKLQNIMIDRGASQLDLWLSLWEEDYIFKGAVEYSTELFDQDTISQMIRNYVTLLESILADPQEGIENYSLLDEQEKNTIVYDFNNTQLVLPELSCFHQLFENQANRVPEKTAVIFEDQELTYGELNKRSNQLSHYLITLGVGPEVLVGIYVERSLEMMIGVLGILKAGGAYVPIDPTYPEERIALMIEDARMPVILTQDKLETSLPENESITICLDADWDDIAQESNSCPPPSASGDNLAYVIFTSGSTGRPKGVQVPHRAVVNFLNSMSREPGFTENDVLLAVTTLSFDIHVLEIFLPLIVGARVVIASREMSSDGDLLLKALNESQATVMQATPSTWRLLLAAGWEGSPNLKILCGGEAFPRDLPKKLLPRAGSVWNMYGPTETTVWSSCYRITDGDTPILIGRPIDNTQVYILDRHMQPVPIGVTGELYIGGDGVTRGYLHRPELTKKQFVPDPFRSDHGARFYKTGDLTRFRPDGHLEWLSRMDTQVKVRGFRIELGEIESVLSAHPSVDKCAAAVREDQPGDVRLVGYIVVKDGEEARASDLRSHLRSQLPDYMVPQHFIELEELPLTPAGKVDRKHLPTLFSDGAITDAEYVAPRNETEEMLATMWQEVIGVRQIGTHENFFDIGGNSLLALQLIFRISQTFRLQLPLRQLFDTPTIIEFALSVENILFEEINSLTDEEAEKLLSIGE